LLPDPVAALATPFTAEPATLALVSTTVPATDTVVDTTVPATETTAHPLQMHASVRRVQMIFN
jgi:hypothetical protein